MSGNEEGKEGFGKTIRGRPKKDSEEPPQAPAQVPGQVPAQEAAQQPAKTPGQEPGQEPAKTTAETKPPVSVECPHCHNKAARVILDPQGISRLQCENCGKFIPSPVTTPPRGPQAPTTPDDQCRADVRAMLENVVPMFPGHSEEAMKALLWWFDETPEAAFDNRLLYDMLRRRFGKMPDADIYEILRRADKIRMQYHFMANVPPYLQGPGQQPAVSYPYPSGYQGGYPSGYPSGYPYPAQTGYPPIYVGYPPITSQAGQPSQAKQEPPPAPQKKYKIVVDKEEIETDEAGFRAWTAFLEDRDQRRAKAEMEKKEWDLRMKKLEQELTEPKEVEIPGDKEGQTKKVPLAALPYVNPMSREMSAMQQELEKVREDQKKAEISFKDQRIQSLEKTVDTLRDMNTPEAISRRAESMGFQRGASPVYGLIREGQTDVNAIIHTLLRRMPPMGGARPPSYTEEQREEKTQEIVGSLDRARKLAEAEEELIAASRAQEGT